MVAAISTDGTVCATEITTCNNPGWGFEESAIEAVRQWVFHPATQRGRAVSSFWIVIVSYQVQEGATTVVPGAP